jgi:protein AFG1
MYSSGGRSPHDPALQREFVLAGIARDMIRDHGWLVSYFLICLCNATRLMCNTGDCLQLAFDEIQLVDIAGASIIRRVLEWCVPLPS